MLSFLLVTKYYDQLEVRKYAANLCRKSQPFYMTWIVYQQMQLLDISQSAINRVIRVCD